MRVKVCGMTDIDQIQALGAIGVDFVGLIFYHKSPRFVLKHGLTGDVVKKAKIKPYKVGVFVNASYDEVLNHVDNFGLDMVQLHGDETPYQCDKLSNYIQTIKAFRLNEYDHVEWKIKDYYMGTDLFLFDTNGAGYGGTGEKFNWKKIEDIQLDKPFLLSGGIGEEDVEQIKTFAQKPVAKDLFAVDVNSKFEVAPGVKDLKRIENFVKALKA